MLNLMLVAALGRGVPGGDADMQLVAVFGLRGIDGEAAPSRQKLATLDVVARRRREHDDR